jgi:hypothetical protein
MNELARVRDSWANVQAEELRLLRQTTAGEGARQFLALYTEFAAWLDETEPLYREERNEAMRRLQARLGKLEAHSDDRMNGLVDSLVRLQQQLEQAGLPSIVIGGLAVGVWGEPRLTRDVDMKILAVRDDRSLVLEHLSYLTPLNADPDEALRRNGIAFFQDEDGVRIDVMLADNQFDETAIGRARLIEIVPGRQARVCSAEDLIIYKMLSLRAKDQVDIETIIRRQSETLNDTYVLDWLRQFELALDDNTLVSRYREMRGVSGGVY